MQIGIVWLWAEDFTVHCIQRLTISETVRRDMEVIFEGLEARTSLDLGLILKSRIHAAMVAIGMLGNNKTMFSHRAQGLVLKWEFEHPDLRYERWDRIHSELVLAICCHFRFQISFSFAN